MRRATITLTDDLEALVDAYLARLETPPSLTVLLQAALRSYLAGGRSGDTEAARAGAWDIAEGLPPYAGRVTGGSIHLDPATELALRQAAAREGLTAEELATLVLREYARGVGRPRPRGVGRYRSGRKDVSSRAEELLRAAARKPRR